MKHVSCYSKDYPRPQFVRQNWQNLNGVWSFAFDEENAGERKGYCKSFPKQYDITVPYSYQSAASAVGVQKRCDNIWYSREVQLKKESGKRTLLHFEGSDYVTKVWVNGAYCGSHRGGYTRFTFDITEHAVSGSNTLTVKAEDSYSCYQPRGKQRWQDENFGCWYTDTNGLWKTVWLETVSDSYLERVRITPDVDENAVYFEGETAGFTEGLAVNIRITFAGHEIREVLQKLTAATFKIKLDLTGSADVFQAALWSPAHPHLYDVEYALYRNGKKLDEAGSYFGMVKYDTATNCINQNDTPFYLKMLLDQGYWKDTHLTPPDEAAIVKDIELTLSMGFNGIRKHQKIEDERFYYYCDIMGVVVWCEMPSCYDFSDGMIERFTAEWLDVVRQMVSHPSVMAWVPFNESWGVMRIHDNVRQQKLTEAVYHLTKALDPGRPVVSNDGWDHTVTDIVALHNYAEWGSALTDCYGDMQAVLEGKTVQSQPFRHAFANGYRYSGQPIVISEFAGIAFSKDEEKGWGYGSMVRDEAEYCRRLNSLTKAIMAMPDVSGYCVTQTTDVQQEVNGLLTEERTCKAEVSEIVKINSRGQA